MSAMTFTPHWRISAPCDGQPSTMERAALAEREWRSAIEWQVLVPCKQGSEPALQGGSGFGIEQDNEIALDRIEQAECDAGKAIGSIGMGQAEAVRIEQDFTFHSRFVLSLVPPSSSVAEAGGRATPPGGRGSAPE